MNSALALQTLLETDPEFEAMCSVLYGPDFTIDEVYDDVFGVSKSEGPSSTDKTLKRVGLAATLIGAGLGVKEIREGAHLARAVKPVKVGRIGQAAQRAGILSKDPMKATKTIGRARVGTAGAMFAGDLAATHGLAHSDDNKVNKAISLQPVKALAEGMRQGWKGSEQVATRLVSPAANKDLKAGAAQVRRGQIAGRALRHPVESTTEHPKAALGAALGVGAVAERRHANKAVPYDDYYGGKRDAPVFEAEGEFTKFDTDKRLAFGWASVVKKDGVDVVDRQGDWIHPDDLENAAYKYVLSSRVGGDMHKRNGDAPHHVSDLVESFVVTPEKIEKMGLPPETPIGWWVGFKIHDEDTWDLVKKRGRTGFSIHGKGKRAAHELEY